MHATRKLPYYFQAYTAVVLTQLPLQALLRKSDYMGRIAKWGIMLGAYDVKYTPCTVVKGQVLTNFVVEFTNGVKGEGEGVVDIMTTTASIILP